MFHEAIIVPRLHKGIVKQLQGWTGWRIPYLITAVILLAFSTPVRADYTATVNPNSILVTNFLGWGTSLCWWANVIGGYANRTAYVDLAFSQLKLNIVRYNIGGSGPLGRHFRSEASHAGLTVSNRNGNTVELNWNYGMLQSAINVSGPYSDVSNAMHPYEIPINNSCQFYRVKKN